MVDLLEKMNFTSDQKKMFNKTKHDCELYRDVILILNSLLKWDKKFYPAIIFSSITIFYIILWYMDFSILTLISLILLAITITDYGYPIVSKFIFKSDNWTGVQEKKFEEICHEIVNVKMQVTAGYQYYFQAKEQKSIVFTVSLMIGLLISAWIGATINNLFLSYLMTLFIAMTPGLLNNGIVEQVQTKIMEVAGPILKNIFPKAHKDSKNE